MDDTPQNPQDRPKEKLLRSKEQWARDGRLLTGRPDRARAERLPPGQHLVKNWPVLDLGIQPDVSRESWRLAIGGLVENALEWDWAAFMAQPQVTLVSDVHCVTAWSRFDNRWQGVATRHLLDLVRPKPEARHVILYGYDGYTTNVRLEAFAAPDALLAHSWEGEPLSRAHGGPVRAVIPQWYFWKSAKWLRAIEFSAEDKPGFWEVRGYHNEGDPWAEERYSS